MRTLFPAILLAFLLLAGLAVATDLADRCRVGDLENAISVSPVPANESVQSTYSTKQAMIPDFEAHLRVYIVEPKSRWYDHNFYTYENGFLDFAIDQTYSIPYEDSITITQTWDGAASGYSDIVDTNIAAIAVVFNNEGHTTYSDPPENNHTFTAYYADAAAYAKPGETASDTEFGNYTHTVFLEEGTSTT